MGKKDGGMMKRVSYEIGLSVLFTLSVAAQASQVGPALDVSPKAEGTRSQLLASAAWCEESKTWLVAWREGYLNEDVSDIWCARIAADGKALDPQGVRLTDGPGIKSRPVAVSDGKGFLVVWEDFRNGKDWDVYGAQVSADGKPAGKNGFLVAGGEHNQARPTATFSKGSYLVAWMGFTKSYGIHGARVSSDGKVQEASPLALPTEANQSVITPALGANGDTLLLAVAPVWKIYVTSYLAVKPLDASSGKPAGTPQMPAVNRNTMQTAACNLCWEGTRSPAIAVGKNESILAINGIVPGSGAPCLKVFRADKAGVMGDKGVSMGMVCERPCLVFDGANYLLVVDSMEKTSKIKGWVVTPDGQLGASLLISEGADKTCLSPAAASGPEGATLVVYSEVRGSDDTKVVARVVK
jgi:hypothetical protein